MNQFEKKIIETAFETNNSKKIINALENYEKKNPYDRDLMYYKCAFYIISGDLDNAQALVSYCLQKFPTSYEAYYYQASIYQAKNMVLQAIKNYQISHFLLSTNKISNNDISYDIIKQISILDTRLEALIDEYSNTHNLDGLLEISAFLERFKTLWGFYDTAPQNPAANIVGNKYSVSDGDLRYIGIYRVPEHSFIKDTDLNLTNTQGEFLKINQYGTTITISEEADEYLIPIASESSNNVHSFYFKNNNYSILQRNSKHFNYYRVNNHTQVVSKNNSYYGIPIPLEHNPKRKKLVLSFFVDGLTQEVIQGSSFKELMPNTYRFFQKGMICTQTYSSGEWTFPSLATYETGLDTLHHMMFHNTLKYELPTNFPTLSEYFHRSGYFTSKMDGDWRSVYYYGYTRGIDQYVYQIQSQGSRAEQEIINVIEHIEAFKDTDQYLWMCVGDLHDIADEYDLSLAVQNSLPLSSRTYEPRGTTSVKQSYSQNKCVMYKQAIKYMDTLFGLLFTYIENNYSDKEIIISLFADHGQGYLVPNDKHFLSKERTHVAFMFRGGDSKSGITNELMSTADYLPIMCKLANIPLDNVAIDGTLPKTFGGKTERKFAITESIHPGDPYSAVAHTNDFEIFFDNPEKVDNEGRFILSNYEVYGFHKNGEPITDSIILQKYEKIFLDRISEHLIYQ